MFERYTEKARRVIFFARFEASQFGASQIEAEHILLGLLREDKNLAQRFVRCSQADIESMRKEIEERTAHRPRVSADVDLPLSPEAKRALAFAAQESEMLGNRHIGTEHLLLGLLREENSLAAEFLLHRGLRIDEIQRQIQGKYAANTQGAADLQSASEQFGQLARDGQAQSSAAKTTAGRAVGLAKRLKHHFQLTLGNANAGITHRDA